MVESARELRTAAARMSEGKGVSRDFRANFEKVFGKGSATADNFTSVASRLEGGAAALQEKDASVARADAGTAEQWAAAGLPASSPGGSNATQRNPMYYAVNLGHPSRYELQVVGHEGLHPGAALVDQAHNGVIGYAYSPDRQQRRAFELLAPALKLINPDHLMLYALLK